MSAALERSKAMSEREANREKVEKPATHFAEPHHVVVDPSLSKEEKAGALEAMEQDARQLATASSEGMSGGEPTKLHEVLLAKESLELPPQISAYELVLQDLQARRSTEKAEGTLALIEQAIASLDPLLKLLLQQSDDGRRPK
jgi:hypothetical protein